MWYVVKQAQNAWRQCIRGLFEFISEGYRNCFGNVCCQDGKTDAYGGAKARPSLAGASTKDGNAEWCAF